MRTSIVFYGRESKHGKWSEMDELSRRRFRGFGEAHEFHAWRPTEIWGATLERDGNIVCSTDFDGTTELAAYDVFKARMVLPSNPFSLYLIERAGILAV